MRIAIDILDVIQVVKSEKQDEYHAVLFGASGKSLLAAWEQKQRDDAAANHPTFEL